MSTNTPCPRKPKPGEAAAFVDRYLNRVTPQGLRAAYPKLVRDEETAARFRKALGANYKRWVCREGYTPTELANAVHDLACAGRVISIENLYYTLPLVRERLAANRRRGA